MVDEILVNLAWFQGWTVLHVAIGMIIEFSWYLRSPFVGLCCGLVKDEFTHNIQDYWHRGNFTIATLNAIGQRA